MLTDMSFPRDWLAPLGVALATWLVRHATERRARTAAGAVGTPNAPAQRVRLHEFETAALGRFAPAHTSDYSFVNALTAFEGDTPRVGDEVTLPDGDPEGGGFARGALVINVGEANLCLQPLSGAAEVDFPIDDSYELTIVQSPPLQPSGRTR